MITYRNGRHNRNECATEQMPRRAFVHSKFQIKCKQRAQMGTHTHTHSCPPPSPTILIEN